MLLLDKITIGERLKRFFLDNKYTNGTTLISPTSYFSKGMSAILSADDLNDFISPGVACIKPVEVKKTNHTGKAEIEIGIDGQAAEITDSGKQELEAAQISLSDCLACSGCITSAESVLVSMQSHQEVLKALESPSWKIFVCSVSHQVRANLAATYGLSVDSVDRKLKNLFIKELKFKHIVGMEVGRVISLRYCAEEALARYRAKSGGPLLSSSCPGWTCYVEKTHEYMIPYLSTVKSPQQITGTLLKRLVSQQYGVDPSQVYHLSLMPCFDKKLEAARPEFKQNNASDVDCVITAKEIVQLLSDKGLSFDQLSEEDIQSQTLQHWPSDEEDWLSNEGNSSGGYMDYVMSNLISEQKAECVIEQFSGKNSDIAEFHVRNISTGEVVARLAYVYGFRNIQNLVRKLKTGKKGKVVSRRAASTTAGNDPTQWDYAEVQACPGGCLNGGGQIGKQEAMAAKEWKTILEEKYGGMKKMELQKQAIDHLLQEVWQGKVHRLRDTQFQAVSKELDKAIPKALQVGSSW